MKKQPFLIALLLSSLTAQIGFSDEHLVEESANLDTQVLQAWETDRLFSIRNLEVSACTAAGSTGSVRYPSKIVDCTSHLEAILDAPLIHKIVLQYAESSSRPEELVSSWACYATEIRTTIKDAVVISDSFKRVGFHHSETESGQGNVRLIAKENLRRVGNVTMRNGESAGVYRFVSLARCWNGTMSSSMYQKESFKPFVDFVVPTNEGFDAIYRRWEDVSDNFVLGQRTGYNLSGYVKSFNREWEILRHD